MPVKTEEAVREKILGLLRDGKSYNQIQKETKVAKPTIWKIKKEAGMVGAKAAAPASEPPAKPTPTPKASTGDGLTEFQPPQRPPKPEPKTPEQRRVTCDSCWSVIRLEPGESLETCPECGAPA